MCNRVIAQTILDQAAQMLAHHLTDAWGHLDLTYYAGTEEPVELMFTARDRCRLLGTKAIKASLPVGSYPLRDELAAGIGEVTQGVQALDDLMTDPRIDLLMRGRARAARMAMSLGAAKAQACLDQYNLLALAADAVSFPEEKFHV